jgi:hypothetical protein
MDKTTIVGGGRLWFFAGKWALVYLWQEPVSRDKPVNPEKKPFLGVLTLVVSCPLQTGESHV